MKALILAGGYATRPRPLSCYDPKLLLPVVGVSLIDLMVNWLREAGVSEVILAVNHLSERLRIEVGERRLGTKIILSVEENPLGTAAPIRLAKSLLDDQPFVVVNGDVVSDINLREMVKSHEEHEAEATVGLAAVPDPKPYCSVAVDSKGVQLGPSTIVSRGVTMGEDAVARESIIFENTTIGRECLIDGAPVGERVHMGLRTRIGRGPNVAGEVNLPSGSLVKKNTVMLN